MGSPDMAFSRRVLPLNQIERRPERFGALLDDPRVVDAAPVDGGPRSERELDMRRLQAEVAIDHISWRSLYTMRIREMEAVRQQQGESSAAVASQSAPEPQAYLTPAGGLY